MSRPGQFILLPAMLISSAFLFFSLEIRAEQLQIIVDSEIADESGEDNWNSHIDNQAYLQNRKNSYSSSSNSAPVIIINRQGDSRSREGDCIYWGCDSWGVNYQAPGYSFTYLEGYRPNRYYPIRFKPKATPHQRKEYNRHNSQSQGRRGN